MKTSVATLIGICSLIVSIVALLLAFQANQFARESNEIAKTASEASVEFWDEGKEFLNLIYTDVCYVDGSFTPYTVERAATRSFTVTNGGGLNASLVEIKFFEGDDEYRLWRLEEGRKLKPDAENIDLPVDIPPGSARTYTVRAEFHDSFEDKDEAIESARIRHSGVKLPVRWVLRFSDGTVITREIEEYTYHNWDVESTVDDPCTK